MKKSEGPYSLKCLNWVLDLFFHWNKCFCYYTESKVPQKGTVGYQYRISGTGTGSNVYPTLPLTQVENDRKASKDGGGSNLCLHHNGGLPEKSSCGEHGRAAFSAASEQQKAWWGGGGASDMRERE